MSRHAPTPLLRRQLLCAGVATSALWLAGCSTAPRGSASAAPHTDATQFWSGRMALQLQPENPVASQERSFSASFELRGSPESGSLQLYSPLGSSLALLTWQPGSAMLQQASTTRSSDSLDELVRDTLGTDLPIPALFAWLHGQAEAVQGWNVDLSRYAEGRLQALRHTPAPQASLRLVLDR